MIMIGGNIANIIVVNVAWSMCEAIPNRFAFSVFIPGAFNLVRGCGRPPDEVLGKADRTCGVIIHEVTLIALLRLFLELHQAALFDLAAFGLPDKAQGCPRASLRSRT